MPNRAVKQFWTTVLVLASSTICADTVYLNNGSYIDGIVRSRDENTILIEIGNIGQLEIALEEVYEIEKNSRTGGDQVVSVEDRRLEVKIEKGKKVEKGTKGDKGEKGDEGAGKEPDDGSSDDGTKPKRKLYRLGERDGPRGDEADAGEGDEADAGDESAPLEEREAEEIAPELKERIEGLVGDLQRQKSRFRVRAERHLKVVGAPSIPFLLPLASDSRDLVRIAVFRLFSTFGDERVVEASLKALDDSNEYVRDYANRTLKRVTHEDFGFNATASPARRRHSQEKWERWWTKEKESLQALREEMEAHK